MLFVPPSIIGLPAPPPSLRLLSRCDVLSRLLLFCCLLCRARSRCILSARTLIYVALRICP